MSRDRAVSTRDRQKNGPHTEGAEDTEERPLFSSVSSVPSV
jgi:hypothetical protein